MPGDLQLGCSGGEHPSVLVPSGSSPGRNGSVVEPRGAQEPDGTWRLSFGISGMLSWCRRGPGLGGQPP